MRLTVLHVSPHPDDELLGAPATLLALRDAGHTVVNYAVSLGRLEDHERRRRELVAACERAGLELVVADPPLRISSGDDLHAAQADLEARLGDLLRARAVNLVVSPSPHDRHHGHEVVGRAVREVLRVGSRGRAWWMWGLWASLPVPTIYAPLDRARLDRVRHALAAHEGEVRRNDYGALLGARARAAAILGSELVFGFGAGGTGAELAELLTEVRRSDGGWHLGDPATLDPEMPIASAGRGQRRIDAWIEAPGISESLLGDVRRAARMDGPAPRV